MKKILGFATSFAFAASLAFASLTLPFSAGQASAQGAMNGDVGPGAFFCGGGDLPLCEGIVIIVDCLIPACQGVNSVNVTITETVMIDIIIDSVTGAFISFAPDINRTETNEPKTVTLTPLGIGNPIGVGDANALEEEALIQQAEAYAEDAARAKAFDLQQAEEEKACRGVPLALKNLLCAAKI